MDKDNFKNEQSTYKGKKNLFKRDGFYVVLFLCLCVVVGVATYVNTSSKQKTSSLSKPQNSVSVIDKSKSGAVNSTMNSDLAKDNKSNKDDMANANLVKKEATKNNTVSVPTSAAVLTMVKPVNGTIALGYTGTDGSMAMGLDKVSRTILGEYIKVSNKSVPVYAAIGGTVLSVDGGRIVILSKDKKLKTVYDNLEPSSISLKQNAEITQNSKIGVIGDSDNAKDRIVDCDHLYFEIDEKQSDGNYKDVNPQNYIKY